MGSESHEGNRVCKESHLVSKNLLKNMERISENPNSHLALAILFEYSHIDGAHHKNWVIDQVVRALTGNDASYQKFIQYYEAGDFLKSDELVQSNDESVPVWDAGIAP